MSSGQRPVSAPRLQNWGERCGNPVYGWQISVQRLQDQHDGHSGRQYADLDFALQSRLDKRDAGYKKHHGEPNSSQATRTQHMAHRHLMRQAWNSSFYHQPSHSNFAKLKTIFFPIISNTITLRENLDHCSLLGFLLINRIILFKW